ncbi:MAG: glycosyltransferase [Oscillospiraceae bacterium]|nr:glycosyltransferase [Oscillospiraceae bacterium]
MQKTILQFVSIVAYVHNNADRIETFISSAVGACDIFMRREVIFVDDCSTDNSVDVIKEYYQKNPADYIVTIIRMGRYHGMEMAMNAGRDMAIGDYVYEFDDLFIDFEEKVIIDAFNKCLEGNDIVTVSTDVPMRLTSKIFYAVFNHATETDSKIGQESFRLLSRRGINRIISMDVEIPYRKMIYLNSGLPSANLKYISTEGYRPARISGKNERVDLAIDSFIYFTKIIQHFSFVLSCLFAILALVTIIYTFVSRGMGYHVGAGWVSTMIFMSLGFTGVFGFLAIIIRYLSVLVDLVFKRQKYLIADVEKISSK